MVPVSCKASKLRRPSVGRHVLALAVIGSLGVAPAALAATAEEEESLRGPDVTIIAEEARTIYEFRQNGELRMVRVVPDFGKPYYLVPRDPTQGFGDLQRADMLLPSWVIVEF